MKGGEAGEGETLDAAAVAECIDGNETLGGKMGRNLGFHFYHQLFQMPLTELLHRGIGCESDSGGEIPKRLRAVSHRKRDGETLKEAAIELPHPSRE